MNILLVNKYFFQKGGADRVFLETGNLLQQNGHKVFYMTMSHPQNLITSSPDILISKVNYESKSPYQKLRSAGRLIFSFEAQKKLKSFLNKTKIDLAHLHNIYHQISPSIVNVLKSTNIPIVMTLHDYKVVCAAYTLLNNGNICEACSGRRYFHCFQTACIKGSRLKSALNTVEMILHHKILKFYEKINLFISPSQFLKEKVHEMGFMGEIEVLPNISFSRIPKHFILPQNRKGLVYFGRLSHEKGLSTLLEACKSVKKVPVKIIGEGPMIKSLKALAQKHQITQVKFLGLVFGEALKRYIQSALAVVLPAEWYENNPLSIIEAFDLGIPVLGSRIGGIPALIKEGQTGFLFEPGDVSALQKLIQKIHSQPQIFLDMTSRCLKESKTLGDPHTYYQKLLKIYERAIQKQRSKD